MELLKHIAPVSALICLSSVAQAQTNHVELAAARARVENENQVRLFWVVTSGWLPTSGVNIYRSDRPQKPLNEAPIKLDARLLGPDAAAKINSTATANKPLFGAGIATRGAATLSSKAAFTAFKGEIQRLKAVPGIRGGQIAAQAAKAPEVLSYRNRLVPPKATENKTPTPAPLTDDEQTISARIQVLIASLSNYNAAQKLGLAFIDKTATGQTAYTYILKSADAAGTELARVTLADTGDVAPPTPAGIDAVQTGQTSVALHWEPVSATEEQKLSGTSYNVFRNGTKLNKSPIRIPFLPTTDGSHIAPMTSYIDSEAPLGTVHYTVTLTDAFGRTSPAAAIDVTMSDLRVPGPITTVVAAVSKTTPGAIRLYWIAPDPLTGDITPTVGPNLQIQGVDSAIAIYRTEGGQSETTLTTAPIPGTPLTDLNNSQSAQIPNDIKDLSVGDFFILAPDFASELQTSHLDGSTAMSKSDLEGLRNESVDKLYARLDLNRKMGFYNVTKRFRSYQDTTGALDKDYRYRIAPCYVANPTHFGTGSSSISLAIPTTAVPATPGGFAGTFQKGQGKFGFVEEGTVPKIRRLGVVGAEVEKPRVVETAKERATPRPQRDVTDKAPAVTIAGKVTLNWQAVPFTSKVRYKVYRAAATGLFSAAQSASVGAPPVVPNMSLSPKLGNPQRPAMSAIIQQRKQFKAKYYSIYSGIPLQNYSLLTVTDKTQFVDSIPVSQRMHYIYRIVPVSRWGTEGAQSGMADVLIPATLPPSLPTLLKTQVDENVSDGHVRLTIRPNPDDENVAKYLIFRKSIAESMQSAQRELNRVRVATTGKIAAPPVPVAPIPQSKVRNLSITTMKANGGAIFKSLLDPEGYVKIGEVTASATPTYVDTSGQPRVPYAYQVVAVNSDNIGSKPSSPLDATAIKVHCEAPRNITAVIAETPESTGIKVSWQVPVGEAPAHYVLQRLVERIPSNRPAESATPVPKREAAPTFITLSGDLAAATTQFVDSSIRSGRKYTYRLSAVDSGGLFSEPQEKSIVVPALAAAQFGDPKPGRNPQPAPAPTPTPAPTPIPGPGLGAAKPPTKRGQFGETYYLTASQQFSVRVEKAVYSIDGYAIDAQNYYYAHPAERFIKLTLRIKNVSGDSQPFDYQTVTARALGSGDSSLPDTKNWKALDTGKLANRTVTPGQEFVVEGIVVTEAAQAPRAIAFGDLAFDLGDPANTIPALDVSPEQPAVLQTPYPLAYTVATVDSAGRSGDDYAVSVTARNATLALLTLGPQSLVVEIFDQDGDKYTAEPVKVDQPNLAPGDSTRLRFVFKAPKAVQILQIKLREKDSRVYVIPTGEK